MRAVFFHTLRESLFRRVGMVFIGVGVLLFLVYVWSNRFVTQPDGSVIVRAGSNVVSAETFFRNNLEGLLGMTASLWLPLGLFVAAPLLASMLEKGWAELIFSKGVARWKLLLARAAGATAVFLFALVWLSAGPALYVWAGTGLSPQNFFIGLSLVLLSYFSVLALMTLVAVAQPNTALLVIVAFLQLVVSRVLNNRDIMLYEVVSWEWARAAIDWLYRLLPKNAELQFRAVNYFRYGVIPDWWAVWSTALFTVAAFGAACWLLRRRNL